MLAVRTPIRILHSILPHTLLPCQPRRGKKHAKNVTRAFSASRFFPAFSSRKHEERREREREEIAPTLISLVAWRLEPFACSHWCAHAYFIDTHLKDGFGGFTISLCACVCESVCVCVRMIAFPRSDAISLQV